MIINLQNLKPGVNFRVHEMSGLTGTLVDINECSANVRLADKTVTWSPATVVETIEASAATSPPEENNEPTCETCGAVTDRDHIGPICPACSEGNDEDEPMKTVKKAPKIRKPKATNVTKGGGGTRVRSSAKTTTPDEAFLNAATPAWMKGGATIDESNNVHLPPMTTKKGRKQKLPVVSMVKEVANVEVPIMLDSVENVRKAVERKLKDHPKQAAKTKPSLLDIAADVLSDGKPRNCDQIITEVLARGDWKTSGKTPAATLYSGMIREINNPNGKKASRFERTATKGEFKAV